MTVETRNKFGEAFPLTFGPIEDTFSWPKRFPIEPRTGEFEPNAYNINSCGSRPRYRATVINRFMGFDEDTKSYEASVCDVFIVNGEYTDDAIVLRRNDGQSVNIDVTPISGWYIGG